MAEMWELDLGARMEGPDRVRFTVWAPSARTVAVELEGAQPRVVPLRPSGGGYFETTVEGVEAGLRYRYVLDDRSRRPDPASRFQPDGVHGPSAVVDPRAFRWNDAGWSGISRDRLLLYELHVGTFTREGTFEAILPHLQYLQETVGITAIELMPVAQFPGRRNWGYDGTHLFAPQSSYGGPDGLKRLVDACHAAGLAVFLDVVYNHLGPEGNYLGEFGPYFTDRYRTPWGSAINYDGPDSDAVRHYVISNALYWIIEYHLDGLRLDAIHGIFDFSASHILKDLALAVHTEAARLNRTVHVIAESDLNDTRIIDPPRQGGYGLDAQWNDDFHHALRVVLTGEHNGYYEDFHGLKDLATALRRGFVHSGQYSPYRRRRHGSSSEHCAPSQFVVFSQNHDQIGNRAIGDRLSARLPDDALKVALAAVLLSPFLPLLFMGEEYGETAPFQYFIEHGDPDLIEAVRQGRRLEFAAFGWKAEEIPDPQDEATFLRSKLTRERMDPRRQGLLRWTRTLTRLRQTVPSLGVGDGLRTHHSVLALETEQVLLLHRWVDGGERALVILGFNEAPVRLTLCEPVGTWQLRLDSASGEFGGSGPPSVDPHLVIRPEGTTVSLPSYAACVLLFSHA